MNAAPAAPISESDAASGWRDIFTGGRLARFALVCVGVWLNAAETLMTATIMPSVAADLRGDAWFGWVVAIYLLGSILAGATAGRMAQTIGLKRALALGGLVYALGCAAGALAPTILLFIAGRFLQGIGGGWIVGLCFVAASRLFPRALWSRVLSALSGVWGVASLVSPLVGGLFAEAGLWRGAFWIFAVQGLVFVLAVVALIPKPTEPEAEPAGGVPFSSLAALGAAIVSIGAAGLAASVAGAAMFGLTGCLLFAAFLRLNAAAAAPLIPRRAVDPTSAVGAGLAMIFCITAGTASLAAYLPALLQRLYGASPVTAGYVLVSEAIAWTAAAFLVAGRPGARGYIRLGSGVITLGVVLLALSVPRGGLGLAALATMVEGLGFGLVWAFAIARLVANVGAEEQALASAAAPTMQMIGTAIGSAASGVIAGLLGFGRGITLERAAAGGFWLYAAFAPLTALGALAAWRLASPKFDPTQAPPDTVD